MKILLVQPYGHLRGHPPTYTFLLTKGILEACSRCNVEVLSFEGFPENWPAELGVKHYTANKDGTTSKWYQLGYRVLGERLWTWYGGTALTAKWAFPKSSSYDVIHFIDATWSTLYILHKLHHAPKNLVLTIVGAGYSSRQKRQVTLKSRFRVWLEFRVLRRWLKEGLLAIVHSEAVQNWLYDHQIASPSMNNLFLIPWGVEVHEHLPTQEEARKNLGLETKNDILLIFGSINPNKSLDTFFEAIAPLPKTFRVLIAGEPYQRGYEDHIKRIISKAGWEDAVVLHLRFIPTTHLSLYHRAASAVILSYPKDFLGASGSLSHAVEYNVPVIASNTGQIGLYVNRYGLGLTYEPDNVESLREAVRRFLSMERSERAKIVDNIREFALNNSWRVIGEKHLEVYRRARDA